MNSIITTIVSLLLFINFAFSQVESKIKTKESKFDTSFVEDISNHLSIRAYNTWKNSEVTFTDITTNKSIILAPNNSVDLGFEFDYKWLGFGFNLGINKINNDDTTFGKTTRTDFQFSIYGNSYGFDAYFQSYKGFYLKNYNNYIDTTFTIYPQLNNMELFSTGLSGYYVFNHKKFSYKAAYVRNQLQKKGQGSMVLGAYFNYSAGNKLNGFSDDVLPDSVKTLFNVKAFTSSSYGINFGYTFTFIIAKVFFINLSLSPGIGIANTNIITSDDIIDNNTILASNYTARFAFGFEKRTFYFGFNGFATGAAYKFKGTRIQPTTSNLKFFFGKRFGMRKHKNRIKN